MTNHTVGLVLLGAALLLFRASVWRAPARRGRDGSWTVVATLWLAEVLATAVGLGDAPAVSQMALPDPVVAESRGWFLRRDFVRPRDARPLVAVVGDSFVAGQGVAAGQALSDGIQRGLAGAGVDADVRNLGDTGRSFFDEAFAYTTMSSALDPDVVVWVFVLNDFGIGDETGGLDFIVDRRSGGPRGLRLAYAARQVWDSRRITRASEVAYHAALAPDRPQWTESARLLGEVVAERKAAGGRVVVAIYPLLHALDAYPFTDEHTRLAAWARAAGAEVVDLLPAFKGRDAPGLWASAADHHPGALAHRLAADRLVEVLAPGPWTRAAPVRCDLLPTLPGLEVPMRDACAGRDAASALGLARATADCAPAPASAPFACRHLAGDAALLASFRARGTADAERVGAEADALLKSLWAR